MIIEAASAEILQPKVLRGNLLRLEVLASMASAAAEEPAPGDRTIPAIRRSTGEDALAAHRGVPSPPTVLRPAAFEHEPSHWRADSMVARFAKPLLAHAKQDSPRARVPHDDSVVNGVSEYLG